MANLKTTNNSTQGCRPVAGEAPGHSATNVRRVLIAFSSCAVGALLHFLRPAPNVTFNFSPVVFGNTSAEEGGADKESMTEEVGGRVLAARRRPCRGWMVFYLGFDHDRSIEISP